MLHLGQESIIVVRRSVHREDIDPDASVVVHSGLEMDLRQRPLRVVDAAEIDQALLVLFRNDSEPIRLERVAETLIIRPGHVDVDVVIPGDEPFVSGGADHRAIGKRVPDAFCCAECMDLPENPETLLLNLLQGQFFHLRKTSINQLNRI